MIHYGLITDQSRKSKAARAVYETARVRAKGQAVPLGEVAGIPVPTGFSILETDRRKVLDIRLQDEHMSPYFKTDMNLFHLLMLDETTEMTICKVPDGVLILFNGLPDNPKPFGAHGHDTR